MKRKKPNGGVLSTTITKELVQWQLENSGKDWLEHVVQAAHWKTAVRLVRQRRKNNTVLHVIQECTPSLAPPGILQTLDHVLKPKYRGHNNHFWLYTDWLHRDTRCWTGRGCAAKRERRVATMRDSEIWAT